MIPEMTFVGVDVSKHRLDLHIYPCRRPSETGMSVENTPARIAELAGRLSKLGTAKVGIEATGGYERPVADALHAAGLTVYIVAPARVRGFARSLAQNAKTDAIDAAMIAAYLAAGHARLKPYRPDPQRARLSALAAHRRRLIAEKGGIAGQLDTIAEPVVRDMLETRLRTIAGDVATLDKTIAALVKASPPLKARHARLCQVAGVGPVLATALLADMPELGAVSAKAAAALLGVAPYARQSGRTNRAGRCTGGRKHLRDIAYMGALSAIKAKDPLLEAFYRRLRKAGKPFKLAIIATVRKLITILNAIARSDPAFAQ
jgi:transposase